ncbi:MAG TPA: endonuclease MutS2 [bacterium]
MDERTLRILEFAKIRERLASRTVTVVGRELAEALLPSGEIEIVRASLAETVEAEELTRDGEVPLRGTHDVRDGLQRAAIGAALSPEELLALRDTLATIRRCKGYVQARNDRVPGLADLAHTMATFEPLEDAIKQVVADDGSIPDGASRELARIRHDQRTTQAGLREKLESLLRGPNARMLQEPIITTRGDRYVVPVRAEHKGHFPGVLHDQSSSGATAFMEPLALIPLGNRLRELQIEEREEIQRLLAELSGQAGAQAEPIRWAYETVGRIDFVVAKALLGSSMHAAPPTIRGDGALRFIEARHPLLGGEVVPIDLWLGGESTTLVITGPNTGGKTVTLKTIGLLTLMAQAGLYLPAGGGSEAAVFPQVFADIGDEQSIEQSLSTFSSHMGAIVGIMRQMSGPALVLLDEIGAGTDPTEGVALARALIEHLHQRGARTVVTTHYNELKALAYNHTGIKNASVEFDTETLRPTYRLQIGLPGRSNALTIAARLGLDPEIVAHAREVVGAQAMEIDRILSDIETDRRAYEYELGEAARARAEAAETKAQLDAELARLRAERQKITGQLREEGELLLGRARREIQAIIEALKSTSGHDAAREARSRLRVLAETLATEEEDVEPSTETPMEPLRDVRPGQSVFIRSLKRTGTVLSAADSRGDVEVETGGMRVKVGLDGLRAVADDTLPKVSAEPAYGREGDVAAEPVPLSISLRGERVDEALPRLDKYLDDAFVARYHHVTIIHGKGTGTLRRAVHDFLSHHPHVRAFRLGERGEGESGATVVELDVT